MEPDIKRCSDNLPGTIIRKSMIVLRKAEQKEENSRDPPNCKSSEENNMRHQNRTDNTMVNVRKLAKLAKLAMEEQTNIIRLPPGVVQNKIKRRRQVRIADE